MNAIFLDRDGTVITDRGYLSDPEGVVFEPGAVQALKRLEGAGFALIFVSNQSGIGRGLMTAGQSEAVHRRVLDRLEAAGVPITESYICPHAPWDGCQCRKPSTLLLERAAAEHAIDFRGSFVIGDKKSDIDLGRAAGCRTILYGGNTGVDADFQSANWQEIADWILARTRADR